MRKGTKKIRKVTTRGNEYYVYDLDEDIFGKKKRLYSKSEDELKLMIKEAENERKAALMEQMPKNNNLKEYIMFYFKNAVGSVASADLKRWITLCENAVFSHDINHDIEDISEEEIRDYYEYLEAKYPIESVQTIDNIMRKAFALASQAGISDIDYSVIPAPQKLVKGKGKQKDKTEYIAEEAELEAMLAFCLEDNGRKYKTNELIITFALLTGLSFDDLTQLKCGSFNLSDETVTIKGNKVSLDERTVKWLNLMQKEGKLDFSDKEAPAFPITDTIQLTVKAIAKRCGLPKGITKKSIHKAFVIRSLEKGISPTEVQKRLGYKNVNAVLKIRDDYEIKKVLF